MKILELIVSPFRCQINNWNDNHILSLSLLNTLKLSKLRDNWNVWGGDWTAELVLLVTVFVYFCHLLADLMEEIDLFQGLETGTGTEFILLLIQNVTSIGCVIYLVVPFTVGLSNSFKISLSYRYNIRYNQRI